MARHEQPDPMNRSGQAGVSESDRPESLTAYDDEAVEFVPADPDDPDDWQAGDHSDPELEEAWLDDMGGRITAPYRDDRELLRDSVALMDLRQQLYMRKVRAREWQDEGFVDSDPDYESAEELEIRRLQRRADRMAERIEKKRDLAAKESIRFQLDAFAGRYDLSTLELDILLLLLVEDITVSGQKTYSRGRDLLGILLHDRLDVLEARKVLYPTASLLREGLVVSSNTAEATVLDAYFKISEKAIHELTQPAADQEGHGLLRGLSEEHVSYRHSAIEPRYALGDVVLPNEVANQVRHVIDYVANQDLILGDWGFGESHGRSGQCTVLFSGPPGTGKTMTAQAIADALGRKVLIVCYPELVSKWVGDTEKNISSLFAEARACDAVLVFDEADAMFHTRVSVNNATDQSFNREVNVLLQEVERFEGCLVLTTNRAESLDPALERRIAVKVEFAAPDAQAREEIWRRHLPPSAPLADDVDLAALASEFRLSGGHIKNAALRAAVSAARRQGRARRIRQSDLVQAARYEQGGPGAAASRRIGLVASA
ncbi:MAG: AAA family ATPase [Armatimonadia bacterium]|nr:AAA family ATPase [Armatimonadia bacterium]